MNKKRGYKATSLRNKFHKQTFIKIHYPSHNFQFLQLQINPKVM